MKKLFLAAICLLCMGCAMIQGVKVSKDVSFKTGLDKPIVMNAIITVMDAEGFGIASISEHHGIIACNPKFIPREGILKQVGLQGLPKWVMLPNIFNPNDEILFSAIVSEIGTVSLRVFYGGSAGYNTVNSYITEKLGERYEQKIKDALKEDS